MARKNSKSRKKAPSTGLTAQARQQASNQATRRHKERIATASPSSAQRLDQMVAVMNEVHRKRGWQMNKQARIAEATDLAHSLPGSYAVTNEGYLLPLDLVGIPED